MAHPSTEFLDLQAALAGEYSLERELGRGGMGVVYLARDVQLDRDIAIKVLPTHLARTVKARQRFVREARWDDRTCGSPTEPSMAMNSATSSTGSGEATRYVARITCPPSTSRGTPPARA